MENKDDNSKCVFQIIIENCFSVKCKNNFAQKKNQSNSIFKVKGFLQKPKFVPCVGELARYL